MSPKDDHVIRILIHTDSHLGFRERDPVRCNDSFASFEESLKEAKLRNVDMVLHAGDMFHENKPSRKTMHSALKIFREQCLGDDPVYISCANKQDEVFRTNNGRINYEDPYHAVSLPYFAIHGNHDDPSRDSSAGDALAALDVLAVSNVLNYYGKSDRADDVEIHPVLITKNGTKLALYGLGAIRDERLNRMWRQKKVKFIRPRDMDGEEKWFNILVLHQNRDYGRGTKNCIHESMIPDWVNVVIWGNEHECKPELAPTSVGCFRIYQPGSSIATSLVRTESSEYPKKYGILEINKSMKFRLNCFDFTQIRPFVYDELRLLDMPELNPQDPNVEDKIKTVLQRKVQAMVDTGRESAKLVTQGAETLTLTHRVKEAHLILARLRVDYDGFVSLNQQRFGALFVGQVANPSELLLFSKAKKYGTAAPGASGVGTSRRAKRSDIDEDNGEGVSKANLEELVTSILCENRKMGLLPHNEMELAMDSFIHKKNTNAISDTVHKILEDTQDDMYRDHDIKSNSSKDAISAAALQSKSRFEAKVPSVKKKAVPVSGPESEDEVEHQKPKRAAAKKAASSRKRALSPDLDSIQDSDEEEIVKPKRSRAKAKAASPEEVPVARKSSSRAATKKKTYAIDDDEENDSINNYSEEEEEAVSSEEEAPASKRGRGTAAKAPAKKAAPKKKAPAKRKGAAEVMDLVSDDEGTQTEAEVWPAKDPSISQVKLSSGYSPAVTGPTGRSTRRGLPSSLTQGSTQSLRRAAQDADWD